MDAYLLGADGKLLPAPPRGRFSEPAHLKPRVELSLPGLLPSAPVQQVAARTRPDHLGALPAH
jgi:hypothetical protein